MECARMLSFAVGALLLVGDVVSAFSVFSQRSIMKMDSSSSLLGKIPNPFASQSSDASRPPSLFPTSGEETFQAAPEALVAKAKAVLASDFGVIDETLLDDNFIWIGPSLGSKVLGKADYLAAGKFFDLRAAFPDLDYRSHDFRIDDKDPLTIRLTARTVGSMRGELRLRNEIVAPNGAEMRCPPEAISMTFDEKTGKLVKLCSGFSMDRLVGNTGGLTGVMGAATVAGFPPSDWEVYPATAVVQRFFGRPVLQVEEPSSFLAPFPETVMIQLAKGILAADMAAADPDLLGGSFTFCTPYIGPINKKKYIESYASEVFGGTEPDLTHFRVDPYDPYRVWVDVRQPEGSPEAMSFTFDDDGFCTRISAWAVMDPSTGSSGGLGGKPGVLYSEGKAMPGIASRPLPQVLGRVQKRIFEPITKVGVDEYRLPGSMPVPTEESSSEAVASPQSPLSRISIKPDAVLKAPTLKIPVPEKEPSTSSTPFFASTQANKPVAKKDIVDKKADATAAAAERRAKAEQAAAERKKQAGQAAAERKKQAEQAAVARAAKAKEVAEERKAKAEAAAAAREARAKEAADARKARAEAAAASQKARKEAAAAAQKAKLEVAAKATKAKPTRAVTRAVTRSVSKPKKSEEGGAFQRAKAAADAAMKKAKADEAAAAKKAKADNLAAERAAKAEEAAAAKKAKANAAAAARQAKADAAAAARQAKADAAAAARQAKADAAAAAKKQREEAVAAAKKARDDALKAEQERKSAAAAKKAAPPPQLKVAPKGVPTVSRWRKNRDGSVTGFITGSDIFEEGEKITTSEIESGEFKKGNVVQTASGSKYFLN